MMWLLFIAAGAGVIALGVVDWGSLGLPRWIRWAAGLPLSIAGNAVSAWAIVTLGLTSTIGHESGLILRGPYHFSRNPQYLGCIAALLGWAIAASSGLALITSLVGAIPLVLVPFAEEPWLVERYGAAYEEYRSAVPRFISLKGRG
jgi:protein-S-isoprenylcysteine O-methyltransferase Ste14